tara:strand:- start:2151 stop:2282 length:132 start_codon:yes stop_codon:yes gene_type:complete
MGIIPENIPPEDKALLIGFLWITTLVITSVTAYKICELFVGVK